MEFSDIRYRLTAFKYRIIDFFRSVRLMFKWNRHLIKKKSFRDYDYSYLLENERFHLQLLLTDFQKCEIVDLARQIKDIKLAIRLLDILLDGWIDESEHYVNTHNAYRFDHYLDERIKKYERDLYGYIQYGKIKIKNENLLLAMNSNLREQKALALYNKLRTYKLYSWSY